MIEYVKQMPSDLIKTPQNSLETPDNVKLLQWYGHPVPHNSPSLYYREKQKRGHEKSSRPKIACLKQSVSVHCRGICKLIPGSQMNHCTMPCLQANKTLMGTSILGSQTNRQLNLPSMDPPGSQNHHNQSSLSIPCGSSCALSLTSRIPNHHLSLVQTLA